MFFVPTTVGTPQFDVPCLVRLQVRRNRVDTAYPPTGEPQDVRDTIGSLAAIGAGEVNADDPLHRAAGLSKLNIRRIRASRPRRYLAGSGRRSGSSVLQAESGFYVSVYGNLMTWKDLAPTITTLCDGYGSGRFGHRAGSGDISTRGGPSPDLPVGLRFCRSLGKNHHYYHVGRHIGNAGAVGYLARIIAKSIRYPLDSLVS